MNKQLLLIFTLTILLFALSIIYAQSPDTVWTKTYGGSDNDYASDVKQTSDNGYIIAGVTASYGTGWWNIYLVKTDVNGDTIWTRYFSADDPDIAYCVQQTADGGYIVACEGFTNLIKTDEFGDSIWTQDYGIIAKSVQQTTDGGYIVGGSIIIEAFEHSCLIKTDSFGDSIWQKSYIIGDVSTITSVQQTADGGYIASGPTHSDEGCWDYLLIKTDATGDTNWTQTYGRLLEPDEGYAVCQTDDGGYIMTGLYFWTVKTDAFGDTLWTRYYGYGEIGCAYSIQQTYDGGYIIGGYIDPIEGGDDAQFYLVKTDSLGNTIWEQAYGTDYGWDLAQSVRQTNDGGYIMTGWTDSFGHGGKDIWLIKIEGELSVYDYIAGDVNMANGLWPPTVIGSDVTYLVNYFKGAPTNQPCFLGGFWCSADANGDCIIMGSDVILLVNYFRGNTVIDFCPYYPPAYPPIPDSAPDGWPNCETQPLVGKVIQTGSVK